MALLVDVGVACGVLMALVALVAVLVLFAATVFLPCTYNPTRVLSIALELEECLYALFLRYTRFNDTESTHNARKTVYMTVISHVRATWI